MKTCTKCGQEKESTEYYPRYNYCKKCHGAITKAYYAANKGKCRCHKREYNTKQRVIIQSGYREPVRPPKITRMWDFSNEI